MFFTDLTSKESAVYKFIKNYSKKNRGKLPTKSEVSSHFEFKSSNSVQRYFQNLEDKGYLILGERGSYSLAQEPGSLVRKILIMGTVAAGLLTEAVEDVDSIDLPSTMLDGNKEYFGLKVAGDSMIEEHILEGDTVILERSSNFDNGDIVVAMSEGNATLKRIYKEEDHIKLVAANPSYAPIIVKNDPTFRVLGKLKSVLRLN